MSATRKIVVLTLVATFEGDYIPLDQVEDYLTQWVDSGLEDRDDLRGWELGTVLIGEGPIVEDEEDDDAEEDAA